MCVSVFSLCVIGVLAALINAVGEAAITGAPAFFGGCHALAQKMLSVERGSLALYLLGMMGMYL